MNSDINTIKNADRNLLTDLNPVIKELNDLSKNTNQSDIMWKEDSDDMGPCLHLKIKFKDLKKSLDFGKQVYDLQEKVDHHTNFVIDNFLTIDVKLSTHHPKPGVTNVDYLFAKKIIEFL